MGGSNGSILLKFLMGHEECPVGALVAEGIVLTWLLGGVLFSGYLLMEAFFCQVWGSNDPLFCFE